MTGTSLYILVGSVRTTRVTLHVSSAQECPRNTDIALLQRLADETVGRAWPTDCLLVIKVFFDGDTSACFEVDLSEISRTTTLTGTVTEASEAVIGTVLAYLNLRIIDLPRPTVLIENNKTGEIGLQDIT